LGCHTKLKKEKGKEETLFCRASQVDLRMDVLFSDGSPFLSHLLLSRYPTAFTDFWGGASVFLRDAVPVVPPDQQATTSFASHSRSVSTSAGPGEASVASTAPATRRGALLRALRSNPAILRVDPADEGRPAEHFDTRVDAVGWDLVHYGSRRESELAADDGILRSTISVLGAFPILRDHMPYIILISVLKSSARRAIRGCVLDTIFLPRASD
jgi:hypothetical protein